MLKRYRYANGRHVKGMTNLQRRARDTLQAKMGRDQYGLEVVATCICGSSRFHPFAERDRYGMRVPIVVCAACGLLIQSPRLHEEGLQLFYNDDYRQLYSPAHFLDPRLLYNREVALGTNALAYLRAAPLTLPRSGRVLDVGCGCGGALEPFLHLGFEGVGCDYDKQLIDFGLTKNLTVFPGGLETVEALSDRFDLVLLNDILEHQREPQRFLERIAALLRPDGLVYVRLPGLRALSTSDYPDILRDIQLAHLYYWDLYLLQFLFRKAGFIFVTGTEHIQAVFQKSANTSTVSSSEVAKVHQHHSSLSSFLAQVERDRLKLFLRNNLPLLRRRPLKFLKKLSHFLYYSLF